MNWKERMIAEWVMDNTYWKQKRFRWFTKSTLTGKTIWPFEKVWVRGLRLPGVWQEDRIDEILRITEFEKKQLRGDIPEWHQLIR